LDLFVPSEFGQAVKEKIGRPFVFGPIEFNNLHLTEEQEPFRPDLIRRHIIE